MKYEIKLPKPFYLFLQKVHQQNIIFSIFSGDLVKVIGVSYTTQCFSTITLVSHVY